MRETLKSVGIDIGTSTTQLVVSTLTLENRASPFTVPRVAITDREIVYRSAIHFTPLLSDTVIDADGVRAIVGSEYQQAGLRREEVETGAVIITGETARKENARAVLSALSEFADVYVDSDKSQVSVIGKNIVNLKGLLEQTFAPLRDCKIYMISQGASYVNISFVVDRDTLTDVVRQIHKYLFEVRQS